MRQLLLLITVSLAAAPARAAQPTTENSWIRATPPGVVTAAAYVTLSGTGTADRLIGARTDAASRVEIHTTVTRDGVMTMTPLEALPIPASGATTLAPGAEHLMLIGVRKPLVPGDRIGFTLVFENGGELPVTFEVRDVRPQVALPSAPPAPPHAQH